MAESTDQENLKKSIKRSFFKMSPQIKSDLAAFNYVFLIGLALGFFYLKSEVNTLKHQLKKQKDFNARHATSLSGAGKPNHSFSPVDTITIVNGTISILK